MGEPRPGQGATLARCSPRCSSTSTSRCLGRGRSSGRRGTGGSASGTGSPRPRPLRGGAVRGARRAAAAPGARARRGALGAASRSRSCAGWAETASGARACAAEMVAAWERHEHFTPLRRRAADARGAAPARAQARARLERPARPGGFVDAPCDRRRRGSRLGGVRPHEAAPVDLPRFALERLGTEPEAAAMVGDSYADDIEGARSLGMQAFLLDRDGRFPRSRVGWRPARSCPSRSGSCDLPSRSQVAYESSYMGSRKNGLLPRILGGDLEPGLRGPHDARARGHRHVRLLGLLRRLGDPGARHGERRRRPCVPCGRGRRHRGGLAGGTVSDRLGRKPVSCSARSPRDLPRRCSCPGAARGRAVACSRC